MQDWNLLEDDRRWHFKVPIRRTNLEQKLERYKNRLELVRTTIGVVVLLIQIIILYHLLTN